MTYIPNVREKKVTPLYEGTRGADKEPRDNAYYEGNLKDEKSVEFKEGFDYAVEAMLNLFNNLDTYASEFENIGLDTDLPENATKYVNGINVYHPEAEAEEATDLSLEEFEQLPKDVQVFATFKEVLNHWMEMERNEIVVSLIENQEEEF